MKFNIEERKPIWIALSDFYLDTELQDHDFKFIASKIKESPYSIDEVKQINKEEVFPVLYPNLLSVAGIWTGFQEEWLVSEILEKLRKRNRFNNFTLALKQIAFKWMYKDYWEILEKAHGELLTPNS